MTGLTKEQIEERIKAGQVNVSDSPNTRTYKQIIRENTLTFFNFLNVVLLVLILIVGSYKNGLFMGIIVINTVIGIVQEVRAKKTIDKLAILTASKAVVLRDGQKWSIPTEELVLDDVIYLKSGDQVPADAVILEGSVEVNESLLTGEADNLEKTVKDELFSGSFLTSGEACCQVVHVGKDNYASQITKEAKEFKKHNSELRNSLNKILKVISIIILPLGIMLFYKQYAIVGDTFRNSVVSTVAGVLGMIPEGLILLTSVALTLGALYLANRKTLVQELYCIETLARVDTLCLDKTGTITEGSMCVERVIPLDPKDYEKAAAIEEKNSEKENSKETEKKVPEKDSDRSEKKLNMAQIEQIMGNLMSVLKDTNATADALREHFRPKKDFSLDHAIPFSSDRKYSGASFLQEGTFLMGAGQFLFPDGNEKLLELCQDYAKQGYRLLVLAHSSQIAEGNRLPADLYPCAVLLLTDVIRPEAPETLAFFDSQGVDLKVISGDDPVTVSAIAKKAGLKNADHYVDATTLSSPQELEKAVNECSVFGRVTPQQKKEMVLALQKHGHTVAMTGDGVNDVLALKEADCSVAMASGSDAAKNIANVVLLDSNFGAMPHIVNQGRKVVNNIRTAASMFLIKTIFSVCLSLLTIFFGESYPFEPIQMSLISACAVGIPTFLLAQEANYERLDKTFLRHVFLNAFPAAVTITACVFVIMLVCQNIYHSNDMLNTACFLVTGWNYMAALKTVYSPLTTYRKVIIYAMQFVFFGGALVLQKLLNLGALEFGMIILVFMLMVFSPVIIDGITSLLRKMYHKSQKKRRRHKFA